MFCGKCGSENVEGLKYCIHCGADITRQLPSEKNKIEASEAPESCPASAAMFRGNLKRTGFYNTRGVRNLTGLKWKSETRSKLVTTPAIAEGSVFFGCENKNLYSLDVETGQQLWKFKTGDAVYSSPAVDKGIVYCGSNDSKLYAVAVETGQEVWRFKTGGLLARGRDIARGGAGIAEGIHSSPAVFEGMVYFGSWDGNLYAVDAREGKEVWRFKTRGSVSSSPAIADDIVYFGSNDGNLYAVDAKTGLEMWRFDTGSLLSPDHIRCAPAIDDEVICFSSVDILNNCFLYTLDIRTGQKAHVFAAKETEGSNPTIFDNVVYYVDNDRKLCGMCAKTGVEVWSSKANYSGEVDSSPAIAEGMIYFTRSGNIYGVDINTRQKMWMFEPDEPLSSELVVSEGVMYFEDCEGALYAVR
jgi:outer membrane protein assembly factor BamB